MLTPDRIRELLGDDAYPKDYTPATPVLTEQCRRRGAELKAFVERMERHEGFIICRFLEGYTPEAIAAFLAAHPETVRIRIRKARLFPATKRGRPPKGTTYPIVRYYREAYEQTRPRNQH